MNFEEGLKRLVRLSEGRGYITYDDMNEEFSEILSADQLDEAYVRLTALEIQILDKLDYSRN
jgi:hypothetical protein